MSNTSDTKISSDISPEYERFEQENCLQGETLVRRGTVDIYKNRPQIRLTPHLHVVKIGGHGVIDYGSKIVFPVVEEIGELSLKHQILIVTGGGVRTRHVLDIGLDLGMPTGVLAELSSKTSDQNATMLAILLAKWQGEKIISEELLDLPKKFHIGVLPVMPGTPPYGLLEYSGKGHEIPVHRTDTGAFLAAEVVGAQSCILGKNVDGIYTKNPTKYPDAELIPEISASELLTMDAEDLGVEPKMLELMTHAQHLKAVYVVNAHKPGRITSAVEGKPVGTIIWCR